jgi:hypothetical protein
MAFVSLPPPPPPASLGQRAKLTAASAVEANGLAGPHDWLLLADSVNTRLCQEAEGRLVPVADQWRLSANSGK